MTTIPIAHTWSDMQALVAGHLSQTNAPRSAGGKALRTKIEAGLSEAPVPIAFNRLAQAIYDAGDAAGEEVKAIGVAIMGGLQMMGTQNLGGLREDVGAMRLALMRELDAPLPVGVTYPDEDTDPPRDESALAVTP